MYKRQLLDLIPQLPVIPQLDDPPALHEIAAAVKALKNNKAAGPVGIPAKVFKFGGHQLTRRLHLYIITRLKLMRLPLLLTIYVPHDSLTLYVSFRVFMCLVLWLLSII